jgi:uncharacterized protein with PQ loop repeat
MTQMASFMIFLADLADTNSKETFLNVAAVMCMLVLGYRSSCRTWFREYIILTVPCLYSLSFAMFVINNTSYFLTSLHGIATIQKNQLHKPLIKFSPIQKGVVYSAINVFNKLPLDIKQLKQNKVV